MRAVVFAGPGSMVMESRPEPVAGPGEVVVTVAAAGICGSDLHGYDGSSSRRAPDVVMGHEVGGQVTSVGPEVDGSMVGQDVAVCPLITCRSCDRCREGAEQHCADRTYIGVHRDGGFADMLVVPALNAVPLPPRLDPVAASLAEPVAVASHAIARAPDLEGAVVLVTGAGPIGCLIAMVARDVGRAARVVNTEVSAARRAVAARMGIETIDPTSGMWLDLVVDTLGAMPDVVFEAVGVQGSFDAALASVRTRGCVILVSGWGSVAMPLPSMVTREVEARGAFNFSRREFEDAVMLLDHFDARSLITDRVPLDDTPAEFQRLARDQGASLKTVLIP